MNIFKRKEKNPYLDLEAKNIKNNCNILDIKTEKLSEEAIKEILIILKKNGLETITDYW